MGSPIRMIADWSRKLAEGHRVNPLIFGLLYFGTIPSYIYGIARFVTSYKAGWCESALWFSVGFASFLAPYLYVLIWGRNLPRRFYLILGGWITIAAIIAAVKIIRQLA